MREALSANRQIVAKLVELEHRLEDHDGTIQELVDVIRELMLPPSPNQRKIGFETPHRAAKTNGRAISLVRRS